jgi:hypothetical protein
METGRLRNHNRLGSLPSSWSEETLKDAARQWVPSMQAPERFRIHTDTSDFFRVAYGDVLFVDDRPFLIRHNAKEGRFGLDDEEKFWVKRAVDLTTGSLKIIKLVFYEKFTAHIGDIEFECFRSPEKEARILGLVRGHKNFMHGYGMEDEKGNMVRILDYIRGKPLYIRVLSMETDHKTYFHERFPGILDRFLESIDAVRFLHEHGEKHGDIRRDHILVDRETGVYRWIDFDYNYRHRENIYGYDLFGLGNILCFLVGKGDVILKDLKKRNHPALDLLQEGDLNMVFRNRVMGLRKIYPYIPETLNRILLHFSVGALRFYEHTCQLLEDLRACRGDL